MFARLQNRMKRLHSPAIGGAWFFVIISLLHLAWVIGAKLPDPAGLTTLYQTSIVTPLGEQTYHAWGLTYDGTFGLIQAMIQALLILAALLFSSLRFQQPVSLRLRRIGHVVLMIWAAWWAMNLIRLAGLDHQFESFMQASLLTILTGCTGYRAMCGWRALEMAADLSGCDESLNSDQITSSQHIRELPLQRSNSWSDHLRKYVHRFKISNSTDAEQPRTGLANRARLAVGSIRRTTGNLTTHFINRATPVFESLRRRIGQWFMQTGESLRSHEKAVVAESSGKHGRH